MYVYLQNESRALILRRKTKANRIQNSKSAGTLRCSGDTCAIGGLIAQKVPEKWVRKQTAGNIKRK